MSRCPLRSYVYIKWGLYSFLIMMCFGGCPENPCTGAKECFQARDIFDLFVLSSQYNEGALIPSTSLRPQQENLSMSKAVLKTAYDNIFLVEFLQFRDSVVAYLEADDQKAYTSSPVWDEIKLKTANFLEELKNEKA